MNDLSNRVLVLERQLQEMQAELVSTRRMFVPQNSPRRVRIAKITQQPSSSGDKKFGVLFLNGEFDSSTLSPGAATFVDRSNDTYQAVAYNLGGKDPSNGDKVFCFEIGDRWWFKVDDGGTQSDTSATIAICSVRWGAPNQTVLASGVFENIDFPSEAYSTPVAPVTFPGDELPVVLTGVYFGSFTATLTSDTSTRAEIVSQRLDSGSGIWVDMARISSSVFSSHTNVSMSFAQAFVAGDKLRFQIKFDSAFNSSVIGVNLSLIGHGS